MGRTRSRSRSRSRSRQDRRGSRSERERNSRSNRRSRSRSPSYIEEVFRIHVANLGVDCSKREITRVFEHFGPLVEVWLARNPPCFAFVVYQHKEDAEEAIRETDGQNICGSRVKVTSALPRNRGNAAYSSIGFNRPRSSDPDLRCYQCGERGHFSRDCDFYGRFRSRRYSRSSSSRSRSRSGSRSRKVRRSRTRSRSKGRRSKSASPAREPRRSSKEKKRSHRSRSRERSRKVSETSRDHRSPSP